MRDAALEALLQDALHGKQGITSKVMFGGTCWLLHGNLVCGARHDGLLFRLGRGNEAWALKTEHIEPMHSGARIMHGWVRAQPEAYASDALREKLLAAALAYAGSLPRKS
jgi:hypothetical protein